MLLIPVLYLRGGIALRPSGDAVEIAKKWAGDGAELVHVIDMDAPPTGHSPNSGILTLIANTAKVKFEVEAAVKSIDTAEKYITAGAERITLGAIAYQKPAFLTELCKKFPKKIAVHIDVRRGKVNIKGWAVASKKTALDYVKQFKGAGVDTIYYSDIEEEGVLKTQDFLRIKDFLKHAMVKAYHTTDINSANDIEQLVMLEAYGLNGTLLSKSLYEYKIDLRASIDLVNDRSRGGLDEPTFTEP